MHTRKPPKRNKCTGWSDGVARRNMRFLWSVDTPALKDLRGYAFTWTVKDCPATPQDFAKALKKALEDIKRGSKLGPPSHLIHYVIEWQRRGVPHVHGVVYYTPEQAGRCDDRFFDQYLRHRWTHYSSQWGATDFCQFVHPVYDAVGWSEYVAKHAARGAKHYQRSAQSLPASWQGNTGRMWGKRGEWPVDAPDDVLFLRREPNKFDIRNAEKLGLDDVHKLPSLQCMSGFAAFRRLMRSYCVAEARQNLSEARLRLSPKQSLHQAPAAISAKNEACDAEAVGQTKSVLRFKAASRSLSYCKRMLTCADREISSHMGLSRWVPSSVTSRFIDNLRSRGFIVVVKKCVA